MDFVAILRRRWKVFAIEVNLRKGGTTHPFTVLRHLVPGRFEPATGDWVATADGTTRCYTSTDSLIDPAWIGLAPATVIDAVRRRGWSSTVRPGRGSSSTCCPVWPSTDGVA